MWLEKAKTTENSKEEGLKEIKPLAVKTAKTFVKIGKFEPLVVKNAYRNKRAKMLTKL